MTRAVCNANIVSEKIVSDHTVNMNEREKTVSEKTVNMNARKISAIKLSTWCVARAVCDARKLSGEKSVRRENS